MGEPFSADRLTHIGMKHDTERECWRIPGTGWRIYDATHTRLDDGLYPWGYDHDEEGRGYGEVESLHEALVDIRYYEERGEGDNLGYAGITIPAIERCIQAEKETNE